MKIISLGAGVQSTVLALMSARGEITPRADAMIFADTGFEPAEIYKHLTWLEKEIGNRIPLHRASAGNIRVNEAKGVNSTGQKFSTIPFFTSKGIGRRQCTNEYKLKPIQQKIREILGVKKGEHVKVKVEVQLGISIDEASRMKPSRVPWITNNWPLIELNISRQDCQKWFKSNYPLQKLSRSACIVCPYKSDNEWEELKKNPEEWDQAVKFDEAIRNVKDTPQFAHSSCLPLAEINFSKQTSQMNLFDEECEGLCGL